MRKWSFCCLISVFIVYSFALAAGAAPKQAVPNSIVDISKENTYPNPTQDLPYLQPSKFAKQLTNSSNAKIENPELIRLLNESSVSSTPFAIGYRATIYLGQWPLNYQSLETSTNWEYQKINTNVLDNRGGNAPQKLYYKQETLKHVRGGLTAQVPNEEAVKKMMLLKAMKKTNLPLAFSTVVGIGTKKEQPYQVPVKKLGYLYAYAPAVNEKGKVTYGEVYIVLKGNKKKIVVKNVTTQGVGAWIPVQDRLSFSFTVSDQPR
ncbi:YfkD famly protein [Thermaerobacillus caldiproteolyticus]|uniref:YfkD famly protein n=1 Tax=Thermaerobacillus caldiproteolyticus TaxID=247480 RepID=UPI00188AED7E|nr:YfkD famly protein [Anoxybacillus caldiproteolyticus]QPA31345.1 YfkD family protein [Anoxybacillus caldiproteolyticus]